MKLNDAVEPTETDNKWAQLRKLIEDGDRAEALALAKEMRAEQKAEQKAESKSQVLELLKQVQSGGPIDWEGIVGVLEIGAAYQDDNAKYANMFRLAGAIKPALPKPLLSAKGMGGAVLTAGNVCVLAGPGGVAKSTLTASIALSFAGCTEMEHGGLVDLQGGIFRGAGGRVMMASFEEPASAISERLAGLAGIWQTECRDTRFEAARRQKVLCANLPEPLYVGYDFAEPQSTGAWDCLWETANEFKPKLIVIDPIIGAYLSNGNDPPRVFAFVKALAQKAEQIGAGVLLVGHSNKAARQSAKYDPYDAGHIAGTSAWTDAARGVMTLTRDGRENKGKTVLAISKANFGPAYIETHTRSIYKDGGKGGRPYGMEIDGFGWDGDNDNTNAEDSNNGKPGGKINTHGITGRR